MTVTEIVISPEQSAAIRLRRWPETLWKVFDARGELRFSL